MPGHVPALTPNPSQRYSESALSIALLGCRLLGQTENKQAIAGGDGDSLPSLGGVGHGTGHHRAITEARAYFPHWSMDMGRERFRERVSDHLPFVASFRIDRALD